MTTHKAWVSGALTALVSLILIFAYGESADGPTLESALTALATSLASGLAAWLATYVVPNKRKTGTTLQAPVWATLAALGLALFMLAGCAGQTPLMTAAATCDGYAGALQVLGTLRAGGQLDDAAADRVNEIRAFATPLCSGDPPTDGATLDALQAKLDELLLMQMEAQNAD